MTTRERSSSSLQDFLTFRNGKLSPERSSRGKFSVFGANGVIGKCNSKNAEGPSIVIGRVGSFCGSVKYSAEDSWVTDNAIICRSNNPLETRFWYYALLAQNLNSRSSGSGQPLLNQKILNSIPVAPPASHLRLAISDILGAIDDKIAANSRLIAAADALAEAQFRAALNEAHPKPLSSFAEFINGKAFTKGASGAGRVVVRIAELNSGIGNSTVFSDADVDDKHLARPGDILFAWSGSLTLHRWYRDEAIINQHIFKVIPSDGVPHWLIYELLRSKLRDFKLIASDKATTMGHIQRKHLDELVLVPNDRSRDEIASIMDSLWQTALNAERENQTLATTRDALLPQLMSGNLTVKGAETLVDSVV